MVNIKIEIEVTKVGDPEISVYQVSVRDEGRKPPSVWPETFGSGEQIKAFLLGLEVAFNLTGLGDIEIPKIPEGY